VDECKLKAANGMPGVPCDEEACIYWRVVDDLDLIDGLPENGCAIQEFSLLGVRGHEIAEWLLSVKERVEEESARQSDLAEVPDKDAAPHG
jgi:hypothetical protein